MALRRLFVSVLLLAGFAGSMLLFRASPTRANRGPDRPQDPHFAGTSLEFTYASQSYFQPPVPGGKKRGSGLSIHCDAKGTLHLIAQGADDATLLFDFTHVLCNDADLIAERGLPRLVRFTRDFLLSQEAVQRATQDPTLAMARSIFLHLNVGSLTSWPAHDQELETRETRLEGTATPTLRLARDQGSIQWTKRFTGLLTPNGTSAPDLTQQLEYEVRAGSEATRPIEMGLMDLQGREQTLSMLGKDLLARTDLRIRLRRVPWQAATLAALQDTPLNARQESMTTLTAEEKEKVLQHWRTFRDHDGQKPALGESENNQEAYLELKQALRHDPTLSAEIAADLNDLDPASSGFATLAGALIYSGEAPALDAFVEQAVRHPNDRAWQERALPMVGLAPAPTAQSWKYLDAMRQGKDPELAVAAELGMATHLKHGYHDPGFVTEIQARLQAAQTEAERLHLLDLIGNAGLDQFYPVIASWLPGASLSLRLRMAQALRFMHVPEAASMLLQMAQDPSLELALTALQCLRDQTPTAASLPTLLQILREAQDDRVRLKALENLYEARRLDAALLDQVKSIRAKITPGPALAEAWDQLEKDWVDAGES